MIHRLLLSGSVVLVLCIFFSCDATLILYDGYVAGSYHGNIKKETRRIVAQKNAQLGDALLRPTIIAMVQGKNSLLYPIQQLAMHHASSVLYFSSFSDQVEAELQRFQPRQQGQFVHIQLADTQEALTKEAANTGAPGGKTPTRQALILDRRLALKDMITYINADIAASNYEQSPAVVVFRSLNGMTTEEYRILNDELLSQDSAIVQEFVYSDEETIVGRMINDIGTYKDAAYILFFVGSYVTEIQGEIGSLNGEIYIESLFIENAEYLGATMSIGFSLRDILLYSKNRDRSKDSVYVPAVFHRY